MPRLSVPLFHGTSTALLPEIVRHGLGARDPVSALRGVACLQELKSVAEVVLANDDWWMLEADSTRRMCQQSVSAGGFNFRHGQTYVSASEITAVRYALSSCVGSELLSTCVELRERLSRRRPARLADIELEYRSLFALCEGNPKPILVRIESVSTDQLLSETGESPASVLASIEFLMSKGLYEALDGHNFVLSVPVAAGAMQVLQINVRQEDQFSPKYTLTEYVSRVT